MSENPFQPGQRNMEVMEALEEGPDKVADALLEWRKASLIRERKEAMLYLQFKSAEGKRTAGEIEAMVDADDERYTLRLQEAMKESEYHRFLEKLLAAKKMADLRTAF